MPRHLIAISVLIPAAFLLPGLALAEEGKERVNQLIVYGDDPCPVSTGDEITVCARKDEAERFRIPEPLRESGSPQNEAWNNRVLAYETVGATGTLSCSPVGAGGSLGCTQKLVDAAYAEKRGASDVRFSQMIAEERARRLSTVDAEAADTQARVEEVERQYDARRQAEEAGTVPVDTPPAGTAPAGN